jgi:protein phosphatase
MTPDDNGSAVGHGPAGFAPQWGHASATGRRTSNQDNFAVDPPNGLWLVADGMGGHHGGEVAAAVTALTVVTEVRRHRSLHGAVRCAHAALRELHEGGRASMGSTVVAALFHGPRFEIAWVGDSRAYLWDGELVPLSRDHSVVQELVDAGAITEDEARSHPSRTVITQALGATDRESVDVGVRFGRLAPGGRLLLCSDGLNGEVGDGEIAAVLDDAASAQEAADRLVALALERGGNDNVTVLIIGREEHAPGDDPVEIPDLGDTTSLDALDVLDDMEAESSRRRSLAYGLIAGMTLGLAVLAAKLIGS